MPFIPKFGVYQIRHLTSGRLYIGSGNIPARFSAHRRALILKKHCNNKLQHAWSKYGPDAFAFEVFELCDQSECLKREQARIDECASVERGFNLCPNAGGSRGHKWTVEQRAKQSQDPQTRAKISAALRGRSPSAETREKLSLANKRRSAQLSENFKKYLTGRAKSPEHRQKLADLNRAKALSPDFREKIAASKRGKKRAPFSAECRANMATAQRLAWARRKGLRDAA